MSTTLTADKVSADELAQTEEFAQGLPQGSPLAIMLEGLLDAVRRGADVTLLASDKELTPNQAAQLLRVSRPHLVKIMDRGLLAYRLVGSNRRIAMADLLDYIERHERANAHVNQLLGTRAHAQLQAMDEAAPLTDEDLTALDALIAE
ncbi:helix-turn-helix domain-containing protein [Arachnia propionica]|jgi:excisionase|uniref:DNA binding domain, excisionase family n=1 Tax=Arachnia propionica TaxID=1750 RepID=A0A448N253_9ACTN|nr:helix-turn-helix domain-containing protein [Arachnia propionica]VEH71488.1 DNA binding domain, excisionase family [Arachnia propionica]